MLNSIVQSPILDISGKVEAACALGEIAKKGGSISLKSLDALIAILQDPKMKYQDQSKIIKGIGCIVEQGGAIALEALHALMIMVYYGNRIKAIKNVLEKISSTTLLSLIIDIPSCQLVFRVCSFTSRAFVIFEGMIYMSDDQQQKSVPCPKEVSSDVIEQMIRLEGLSISEVRQNSSISSNSSSLSIVAVQLENPYRRLDDVFESVYKKVLMEEDLDALVATLNGDDADPNQTPKTLLVKYLVSKCIEAANQDERFAELKKILSYITITGLEKIAGYYSIRKSFWIEGGLEKNRLFFTTIHARTSEHVSVVR